MRTRHLTLALAACLPVALIAASPAGAEPPRLNATVIQRGLVNPWDVAFAPDGRMLVTERPGRIRVYNGGRAGAAQLSVRTLKRVRAEGEAGVMGIAVLSRRPDPKVFVCASRTTRQGRWRNQLMRYRLGDGGRLHFERVLIRDRIRANTTHDGCAVQIGPDRKVWLSTGDAGDLSLPQRGDSYNGKILRINPDWSIPAGNPGTGTAVWSRGHRNPQGIAFRPGSGDVYAVEHGPDVNDEVNRIVRGGNYGWPYCAGTRPANGFSRDCSRDSSPYRAPRWQSGAPTLATSGAAFTRGSNWGPWRNDLFVSTLKESDLRRFAFDGPPLRIGSTLYNGSFGRLRGVSRRSWKGGDALFLTTSNGSNDRVVRITARR